MMGVPRLDSGDYFQRLQRLIDAADMEQIAAAQREWLRRHRNPYNPATGPFGAYPRYDPPIAGPPEPEDTTGLKMLDEFLTKRRSARDGDERE